MKDAQRGAGNCIWENSLRCPFRRCFYHAGYDKKIVDMDEKAQEITEEAKRSKALSAQEIAETKERIRENYLARARKRIELNRIQEKIRPVKFCRTQKRSTRFN